MGKKKEVNVKKVIIISKQTQEIYIDMIVEVLNNNKTEDPFISIIVAKIEPRNASSFIAMLSTTLPLEQFGVSSFKVLIFLYRNIPIVSTS
jgi:hypothetical protein